MKEYQRAYQRWVEYSQLASHLKSELVNLKDEKEIEDRFYQHLEFGTAGMRGVIGAGTNRLNKYTIRRATEGLARYLVKQVAQSTEKGVVIAYDSRHFSPEFAAEASGVLAAHGIQVYLFQELRPTPVLSFAVRHLGAAAGIVITASHNPPEYNGYKVYGADGGQIPPQMADQILAEIHAVENELDVEAIDLEAGIEKGLIHRIGPELDVAYTDYLLSLSLHPEVVREMADRMPIVYTPLHGTGNKPMRKVLQALGFAHVQVVPEQELPDPDFSTVSSPNPEERQALNLALQWAKKVQANVVIGTDPDADRLGVAVKGEADDYVLLNGNQIGALLLHYLLEQKSALGQLPANGVVIKTIVTSELGRAIAEAHQVKTLDVLTGFKYIGEKINEYEATKQHTFLFGYEESNGYLIGDRVRDKDAIQAGMLLCEMAAFYQAKGLTLWEVLQQIYETHGYYREELLSFTFKGLEGQDKMKQLMNRLREQPLENIGGQDVRELKDYALGLENLPKANVLKYSLADGSWMAIRPSGTEPKIKFYFSAVAGSMDLAEQKIRAMKEMILQLVEE